MHVIGLVGGIASGKSTVADELAKLGAEILDADAAVHRALDSAEVKALLTARWGPQILDATGKVDRQAVAAKVFQGADARSTELEFLESVLHPIVRLEFENKIAQLEPDESAVVVIDAPLLLEAGWKEMCNTILMIETPSTDRAKRVKTRNWTEEALARREAAQMPIEQKKQLATRVLRNEGSLQQLRDAVKEFWYQISADSAKT